MNTFKSFFIPLIILYWIATTLLFTNYIKDSYNEFARYRSDLIINYAVDAAVDEMVRVSRDLDMDYSKYEYQAVDPQVALDTFISIYLESYRLNDTDNNRARLTAGYLKSFLVATYDGYYVGEQVDITAYARDEDGNKLGVAEGSSGKESGAHDVIFSLKKPYTIEIPNKVTGFKDIVSVNLGLEDCLYMESLSSDSIADRKLTRRRVDSVGITENQIREVVSTKISDDFMSSIFKQTSQIRGRVYIPSSTSVTARTSGINGTTVMAYLSEIPIGYQQATSAFAVGGAKVDHQRFVALYKYNGIKYYQYVDLLPENFETMWEVDDIVESARLAAERGYHFDMRYFK